MHAKPHNRLHSFWTSDGKILVKMRENDLQLPFVNVVNNFKCIRHRYITKSVPKQLYSVLKVCVITLYLHFSTCVYILTHGPNRRHGIGKVCDVILIQFCIIRIMPSSLHVFVLSFCRCVLVMRKQRLNERSKIEVLSCLI